MKRLIIKSADGHINIQADMIVENKNNNMLYAYVDETLVGIFEMSTILQAYLSEKG